MDQTRTSKFISLVLRHDPSAADVTLDEGGWADVEELLDGLARHGHSISRENLLDIVRTDAKQRYALSDEGRRIRANQGHSIQVDLGLEPAPPPEVLFHGTARRFAEAIGREGLKAMGRHHVHLSPDETTARAVGQRHGRPVIFRVAAGEMARRGHAFYRSANGVWLVDAVPAEFLAEVGDD
jgi:putative RNA 2'-phosphotransferase